MAKIKKTLPWLCIAAVVLWTLFGTSDKSLRAQSSSGPDADVIAKLDTVLGNQKAILDNLASIKEDLRIIKIRITQQQ
jgi:hypothetical protein